MFSKLVKYLPVEFVEKFQGNLNVKQMQAMILKTSPEDVEELGRKKAVLAFRRAAEKVPHYNSFIKSLNLDYKKIKTYEEFMEKIPVITKKSYVKTTKNISELCVGGNVKYAGFLARSSGYTGKSSTWAKGREEQVRSKKLAAIGLQTLYESEDHSTLLIDSFALGSWVSGVDLLLIADTNCTVISPGADMDESLSIFEDLNHEFDQVIFAGTPHFLKNLAEAGIERGINWKRHKVHMLVGAEPISEEWRNYVKGKLGNNSKIYSAYGSSDLGVTGVNENEDSVALRRVALKDRKLGGAIFGKYLNAEPILFQYDPTKYQIVRNANDELEFTNCDLTAIMPLIRYNIKDIGGLFTYKEMQELLLKHDLNMQIKYPLPFVFVVGRSDGTISFIGQEIYPQYVEESVYSDPFIANKLTDAFKISQKFDAKHNPYLLIEFQLKSGKPEIRFARKIRDNIEDYFYKLSSDFILNFKLLKERSKDDIIRVQLYSFDDYPYKDKIKIHRV